MHGNINGYACISALNAISCVSCSSILRLVDQYLTNLKLTYCPLASFPNEPLQNMSKTYMMIGDADACLTF